EPSAQYRVTLWPRPARPVARSATIACAPPAGAGTGRTGDAMIATFTAGSYGRDLRRGGGRRASRLADVRALGHRSIALDNAAKGARNRSGRGDERRAERGCGGGRTRQAGPVLDFCLPAPARHVGGA